MARARTFTILYFFIYWQKSNGQQCSLTANPLGHQQIAQNNIVFNKQTSNQNLDSVNFNTQLQQSARQLTSQQQSLNVQQLSNIPTQTNNIQQTGNLQHHGGAQSVNCQPTNQAIHVKQVPQNLNMKQDVPLQTSPNSVNLQQATVVPVNSPHVNIVQQSVGSQSSLPVQGLNFQQQSYAVNTQKPSYAQSGGVTNFQQQTSPQSVSFQQPIVVQPVNLQQQITPQDNFHQHPIHHTSSLLLQSTPIVANLQQAPSSPVLLQQPPIVQPLNYVDLLPMQNQSPLPSSPLLQSQSLQQLPREKIEVQQHNPYNIPGGFQVISYQNPCQQSEITTNLPVALQLSTISSNSNPAIITAVPASLSNFNAPKQSTDNMNILTPQNYLSPASYSPIVVTENFQPTFPTCAIVPITTVTNTIPASFTNLVNKNNQFPEMTEFWTSSLRLQDKGTELQEQFPIASLLESISPVQSAILSSILSSMQSPSTASQYVISSNYPAQTIVTPQSGSQSSKLSLKCLLPLLLDLIQEKYTNHGCQCNCCNCQCLSNHNDLAEPQINECFTEAEEKGTQVNLKKKKESNELKEILNPRQHKKENNNLNVIPDDSKEIEDTENSNCEDAEEDNDVVDESEDENDT